MTALVPFNAAQLPAAARQKMASGQNLAKNFTEGVGDPLSVLSIKGKNFTIRLAGQDPDPRARPLYEIDVVVLDGTPNLGKTYYINPFAEGSMQPPDCWSLNGIKPDPGSPAIQSPTCRGCQWNVFGSKISQDRPGDKPSKSKACSDSRRIALLPAGWVNPPEGDPPPLLLRVPATSLKPLKDYAVTLDHMGAPINAVITRLGFAAGIAHPQLTFAVVRPLTDDEFAHVDYLGRADEKDATVPADDRVRRILEAPPPVEELTPEEFQGQQVTNRTQAAPIEPAAVLPETVVGGWKPGATHAPTPQPIAPQSKPLASSIIQMPDGKWFDPATMQYVASPLAQQPAAEIITLPDGRQYNPVTKTYIEPEPEGPPEGAMQLPDGKWYVPATKSYWEPAQAAVPISQRAAVTQPPANPTPANAPAPAATPGWKPAGRTAAPDPTQGWTPADIPKFIQADHAKNGSGTTIEGSVAPPPAEAAAAPAAPKKRKPASPPSEQAQATQQAPAALDALLGELDLGKK